MLFVKVHCVAYAHGTDGSVFNRAAVRKELLLSELELFVKAGPENLIWVGPGLMSLLKPREVPTSFCHRSEHSVSSREQCQCLLPNTHHRGQLKKAHRNLLHSLQ